jgi:hypothetical protein
MTILILQIVLMGSLAVIVYLMALAVPRIEEDKKEIGSKNGVVPLPLDKLDAQLNKWKDRILRRLKVFVMKADNYISKQLKKEEKKL